jgi:hypothetical protein
MKWAFRWVLFAALGGAAWALWPNEAHKVRKGLEALAADVSFSPRDGNLARLASIEAVTSRLTADAELQVDSAGFAARTLSGREEIREVVAASRGLEGGIQIQLFDIVVTLGPDEHEAKAALTASARSGGTELVAAQEFVFELRKQEGRWRVRRIQAVRTLQK